jgi:hypothetical protein
MRITPTRTRDIWFDNTKNKSVPSVVVDIGDKASVFHRCRKIRLGSCLGTFEIL